MPTPPPGTIERGRTFLPVSVLRSVVQCALWPFSALVVPKHLPHFMQRYSPVSICVVRFET